MGILEDLVNELKKIAEELKLTNITLEYLKKEKGITTPQMPQIPQTIPAITVSPEPTQQQVQTTGLPVSGVVPQYTREQISLAMGRAIDMGLMDKMHEILTQNFGVQSIMELKPDKYNDLVFKLKEIGIEV